MRRLQRPSPVGSGSILLAGERKHHMENGLELSAIDRFRQEMVGSEGFRFQQRGQSIAAMHGGQRQDFRVRCPNEETLKPLNGLLGDGSQGNDREFYRPFFYAAQEVFEVLGFHETMLGIRDGFLNGRAINRVVIQQQDHRHR